MKKTFIIILLVVALFPFVLSAGDNFIIHASDGSTSINGTDVCVDIFGTESCLSDVVANASGDITSVTAGTGLLGGGTSGAVTLNVSSDTCGAGNYSRYNGTHFLCFADQSAAGGVSKKGDGGYTYNDSTTIFFNTTVAGTNLSVNSSDYWDDYNTANTTWFQNIAGALSINLTQLTSFITTWFGTQTTDDLTEGSTNLYENSSFNESHTDTLYADISVTGDNSSFNESHTDTLYAGITEPLWSGNTSTVARVGDCAAGQFVVNTTNSGVECDTPSGSGDITSVEGDDIYIYNGSASGDVLLAFNETKLNETIGLLATSNASFNETHTDTLYAPVAEPLSLHLNQDNWYNDSNGYLNWDGDSLEFNTTKITTNFFNVTSVGAIRGTTSGVLNDINLYDSISYNVTEEVGAEGMDFRINFSGIAEFNQIILRYRASNGENHITFLQMWNYDSSEWENYATLSNLIDYNVIEIGVYDNEDHVSGGIVQIRVYSSANGNTGHIHFFDWVAISQGLATPAGSETDPLSIHKDGDISLTANWDQGGFNLTNTLSWFLGKVDWSTIQNKFVGSTTDDITEGSTNLYDNSSWNESHADTLYADISVTGDNSSWNESQADTLYYLITNPYTFWNDTYATFNKTYADTLYAGIGDANNDSWNETHADTLYANINHLHPAENITAGTFGAGNYVMDTNLTVEKLVFENSANHFLEDNSTCVKIYGSTSTLEIC